MIALCDLLVAYAADEATLYWIVGAFGFAAFVLWGGQ